MKAETDLFQCRGLTHLHATAPEGNVAGPAKLEKTHPQNSDIKKNLFMVNNFLKFLQALNDTTLYHP